MSLSQEPVNGTYLPVPFLGTKVANYLPKRPPDATWVVNRAHAHIICNLRHWKKPIEIPPDLSVGQFGPF